MYMNRIPPVRTWKVTVNETGEVLYFDTINKNMVRIILRMGCDRHLRWGKTFKISVVKEKKQYEQNH
jgi:hypothetical protein